MRMYTSISSLLSVSYKSHKAVEVKDEPAQHECHNCTAYCKKVVTFDTQEHLEQHLQDSCVASKIPEPVTDELEVFQMKAYTRDGVQHIGHRYHDPSLIQKDWEKNLKMRYR